MGSATTLIEAKPLGRRSIGLDLNLISCLMAEAKLLDEPSQEVFELIDRFALNLTHNWNTAIESSVPDTVQAEKWYTATTLAELRKIWGFVEGADQRIQKILRSAFSAVLLPSCKKTRHWGYVCDNSSPKTSRVGEAKRLYFRALKRFRNAYLSRRDNAILPISSRVLQGVSRVALGDFEDSQVDCFVTSPPHQGVADYVKAQRLSMEWFGFDIEPLRKNEIGARSKRSRKNCQEQFITEIGQVFDQTARVLKPDGYGLIVFGTSPSRADTLQPFLQRIEESGFAVVVQKKRTISNGRRQMPSLTVETVLVVTRK